MLLGFKKRFAPSVEDGSKTHTIRARRKRAPRVGEICHCYTGLRQKGARLLGRFECVRVQEIRIRVYRNRIMIAIDGIWLSEDEVELFARSDGFQPVGETLSARSVMARYWSLEGIHAFTGDLIHWEYRR